MITTLITGKTGGYQEEKMKNKLGNFFRKHPMIIGLLVIMVLLITCTESRRLSQRTKQKPQQKETQIQSGSLSKDWSNLNVKKYTDTVSNENWTGEVESFYKKRANHLAWFNGDRLNENAQDLIHALDYSWKEGLSGNYYNFQQINQLILQLNWQTKNVSRDPALAAQLDVLLTHAYINFASDLLSGHFNPSALDVIWETYPKRKNLISILDTALKEDAIPESLDRLRPSKSKYSRMVAAYDSLLNKKMRGEWPVPGAIPALKEGDSSRNVVRVKKFLLATGDLIKVDSVYIQNPVYDQRLAYAVERFQERHGIERDGIVGENTLAEMNKPLEYRINQLKINLDRIRWMPEDMGDPYILVNIPDYHLKLFEDGKLIMQMKVIVGKLDNYTPILKDTISYIVFNPSWNVPYSIATEEMLPKIKRNPDYLTARNYILLRESYAGSDTINPQEVDWSDIDKDNFPFFIVQKPGINNALGTMKFMMPNSHAIYLHDTPSNHLFNQSQRDFSHGCIRLEKPYDLAEYLLKGQLDEKEIYDILSEEDKKTVILDHKVTVHFIYHTAWVDNFGNLQFRDDVYNFDEKSFPLFNQDQQKDPLAMQGGKK